MAAVGAVRSGGAVAAGHPETAEAGAWALREGGNAVDAAIAAVLASVVAESPLTGLGAGGYMLVHEPGGRERDAARLLRRRARARRPGARAPSWSRSRSTSATPTQVFNIGAASCGVPGVPAGLAEAQRRFGSMPLAELVRPAVELARDGVRRQRPAGATCSRPARRRSSPTSRPAPRSTRRAAARCAAGDRFAFGRARRRARAARRRGRRALLRRRDRASGSATGSAIAAGLLARAGPRRLRAVAREPVSARFLGREVLHQPPAVARRHR